METWERGRHGYRFVPLSRAMTWISRDEAGVENSQSTDYMSSVDLRPSIGRHKWEKGGGQDEYHLRRGQEGGLSHYLRRELAATDSTLFRRHVCTADVGVFVGSALTSRSRDKNSHAFRLFLQLLIRIIPSVTFGERADGRLQGFEHPKKLRGFHEAKAEARRADNRQSAEALHTAAHSHLSIIARLNGASLPG